LEVKTGGLRCLRCGYCWWQRKAGRPEACPGCKNPKWDVERGTKVSKMDLSAGIELQTLPNPWEWKAKGYLKEMTPAKVNRSERLDGEKVVVSVYQSDRELQDRVIGNEYVFTLTKDDAIRLASRLIEASL
jgi:hypothetical protein